MPMRGKKVKSYIIPHHMAHCASVYYTSSFDDAYCFSMDCSMGKPEANSLVAYGKGKKLFAEYCPNRMDGVLYGNAFLGDNNNTQMSITPFSTAGTATIVVTGQNKQPYIEKIKSIFTVFLKNHYDKIVDIVRNTIIRDQEDKNRIFIIY